MTKPTRVKQNRSGPTSKLQMILRAIAFVPLSIVLLERARELFEGPFSGYLHVDTMSTTTIRKESKRHVTLDILTPATDLSKEYPLSRIMQTYNKFVESCNGGTQRLVNQMAASGASDTSSSANQQHQSEIPKMIHLPVGNSKCVKQDVHVLYQEWKAEGWSTYFHDKEAMNRLLKIPKLSSEFPQFSQVVRNCVGLDSDSLTLVTALWRYLVLYMYGGIYTEAEKLQPFPALFSAMKDADAVLLLFEDDAISSFFLMASPGHPLLYFALHHTLLDITQPPTHNGEYDKNRESALIRALLDFQKTPFRDQATYTFKDTVEGTDNRSVTIVDVKDTELVQQVGSMKSLQSSWLPTGKGACQDNILNEIINTSKKLPR